MSETVLFIGIIVLIIVLIICIHIYDRSLVRSIKIYEKRLEEKGIFKRHFISSKIETKNKITVKCSNCSKTFTLKANEIPSSGRIVKCGHCSKTWRQMPLI